MASCPSCNAPVEEGADLCLECGEPMGDAPAAKTARADAARPPSGPPPSVPSPSPSTARPAPPPSPKTVPAMPAAKRKWVEEPEPLRCPGCGAKSHAARCPNCGTPLRRDDD